jgi:hypothetical protein
MSVFVLGFTKNTKEIKAGSTHLKLKKVSAKPKLLTYFEFYDQNGAQIDVSGVGTGASGTINNFIGKIFLGQVTTSGSISGTYTISGGSCYIDVTFTPYGENTQYYQGSAAYSENPFIH